MNDQTEQMRLIRLAHEVLDRIQAALKQPWFKEEEEALEAPNKKAA